jgi:hypothetical protein
VKAVNHARPKDDNDTTPRDAQPSRPPNESIEAVLKQVLSPEVVNELRQETGYNPRQRKATAFRVLLVVIEGFWLGQTLSFSSLRALFIRRFGSIGSSPFQNRFKQETAATFFRIVFERLIAQIVARADLHLKGPLRSFSDVRIYDGTCQRVPARGKGALPAYDAQRAGSKWVMGYSLKTGLLDEGIIGSQRQGELPQWHTLVSKARRGVLYLLDLGYFEREIFAMVKKEGAHVLMRLKSSAKVRIVGHLADGKFGESPGWSLSYYLSQVTKRRGTLHDLDVVWGKGKAQLRLRLVGMRHSRNTVRWYLTTVPRSRLNAKQVVQVYRLRWLVELLFREIKQASDLGRSFTGDRSAIEALTYGAMISHALIRSLRIDAALTNEVPLEQLRPIACLNTLRAYATSLVDALVSPTFSNWKNLSAQLMFTMLALARERKPSRSRMRIALQFGACGA